MTRRAKVICWILVTLCVWVCLLVAAFAIYRYHYPYGFPAGKLSTFRLVLEFYAENNDGWYPRGMQTSLQDLQLLYPDYDSAGLAGLSGSERRTMKLLENGKPLDERASSWVYWPGFRSDDDPNVAIIWEKQEGLFITGARADGHAVGFAGGGYGQISSSEWSEFLYQQEIMRKQILESRSETNPELGTAH